MKFYCDESLFCDTGSQLPGTERGQAMNDIIPFGKYRGQEIEQIRQRDPAYLQWLVQQAWFSEKFAPIYQLVINNFAPASEETPAHNAMQVRFLDFNFQSAFWHASGADAKIDWENLVVRFNNKVNNCDLRKAPKPCSNRRHDWALKPHRELVRSRWKTWRYRNNQPQQVRSIGSASFEEISDVCFKLIASVGFGKVNRDFDVDQDFMVYIEIKPSMGDDYPAVLRQMKRQRQQLEGRTWDTIWCLLIDEFASQAVTLEQVRNIFARDAIKVVLMQDVRDCLLERQKK
jgi:hypothetical protein